MKTWQAAVIYISAIVIANLSVWYFGPKSTPINAFLLIGLDLSLRDHLHDKWIGDGLFWKMGGLIAIGSLSAYLLNPESGIIAIASCAAFASAAVLDGGTYHALRKFPWVVRGNGSNVVGAITDSVIFPTVAFGVFMPQIIVAQAAAKIGGGLVWSLVIRRSR